MSETECVGDEVDLLSQNKDKSGIIYLSVIPPKMNVALIKEYFTQFGEVNRVFLQPSKTTGKEKKKKKKFAKSFDEGWVEFLRKSKAKKVAVMLNNQRIGETKHSKHYDMLWNIKYLPGFKWSHLNERLAYEKAVHQQRIRTEISQTKKESDFYIENINRSNRLKRKRKDGSIESPVDSKRVMVDSKHGKTRKEEDPKERIDFLKSLFTSGADD